MPALKQSAMVVLTVTFRPPERMIGLDTPSVMIAQDMEAKRFAMGLDISREHNF